MRRARSWRAKGKAPTSRRQAIRPGRRHPRLRDYPIADDDVRAWSGSRSWPYPSTSASASSSRRRRVDANARHLAGRDWHLAGTWPVARTVLLVSRGRYLVGELADELARRVKRTVPVLDEDDPELRQLRAPAPQGRLATFLCHPYAVTTGVDKVAAISATCRRGLPLFSCASSERGSVDHRQREADP
jgi:hypothetical protein